MSGICLFVSMFFIVVILLGATKSPSRLITVFGVLGATWLSLVTVIMLLNIRPGTAVKTETLPSSVRENPASYRPVLILYSGYHSRFSTGGYSGGK